MNHPGEIAPLAEIARPDVGVITNVGMAHIEFMGSRDAIAQEKGMLAEAVREDGCIVLNADDEYTPSILKRTKARPVLCGIDSGDVRVSHFELKPEGTQFEIITATDKVKARIAVPGEHMVRNALLAVATGIIFGLSPAECAAGLENVHLTKGRLEQKTIRGVLVIDDSYNANPDSMVAALRTLAQMPAEGKRIAILGRMGELGAESERGHRQVGEAAGRLGIGCVVSVGPEAALISDAAEQYGVDKIFRVSSTGEAAELLRNFAHPGDVVLVKGSRSARMEKIVEGFASL
jgi:UDP-N-acetylmuramoyl-tripeptide--D-alanyl-D-alanine ligase